MPFGPQIIPETPASFDGRVSSDGTGHTITTRQQSRTLPPTLLPRGEQHQDRQALQQRPTLPSINSIGDSDSTSSADCVGRDIDGGGAAARAAARRFSTPSPLLGESIEQQGGGLSWQDDFTPPAGRATFLNCDRVPSRMRSGEQRRNSDGSGPPEEEKGEVEPKRSALALALAASSTGPRPSPPPPVASDSLDDDDDPSDRRGCDRGGEEEEAVRPPPFSLPSGVVAFPLPPSEAQYYCPPGGGGAPCSLPKHPRHRVQLYQQSAQASAKWKVVPPAAAAAPGSPTHRHRSRVGGGGGSSAAAGRWQQQLRAAHSHDGRYGSDGFDPSPNGCAAPAVHRPVVGPSVTTTGASPGDDGMGNAGLDGPSRPESAERHRQQGGQQRSRLREQIERQDSYERHGQSHLRQERYACSNLAVLLGGGSAAGDVSEEVDGGSRADRGGPQPTSQRPARAAGGGVREGPEPPPTAPLAMPSSLHRPGLALAPAPPPPMDVSPAPGRSILKRQPHVYGTPPTTVAPGPAPTSHLSPSFAAWPAPAPVGPLLPPPSILSGGSSMPNGASLYSSRRSSAGDMVARRGVSEFARRSVSSKELGDVAPLPGSPYTEMLYQKDLIEASMNQRLSALKESTFEERNQPRPRGDTGSQRTDRQQRLTNQTRNRRRAEHNRAVISDLCEIVTELFMAESKLLSPSNYGVGGHVSSRREEVLVSVESFLSDLPPRYALGVDTPSEVLVHMRLMAAARSDDAKAAVHIVNLERENFLAHGRPGGGIGGGRGGRRAPERSLRLVTISCSDHCGLLEYITKLLGTGGSRVVDADVMLSSDNIALDRFVVEMNGRLRLDKLQQYIEAYLKQAKEMDAVGMSEAPSPLEIRDSFSASCSHGVRSTSDRQQESVGSLSSRSPAYGPLYFNPPPKPCPDSPREKLQEEMQSAVPLSQVIASSSSGVLGANRMLSSSASGRFFRHQALIQSESTASTAHDGEGVTAAAVAAQTSSPGQTAGESGNEVARSSSAAGEAMQGQQQNQTPTGSHDGDAGRGQARLVNRPVSDFGDLAPPRNGDEEERTTEPPGAREEPGRSLPESPRPALLTAEHRVVPVIPFDNIMLIEPLGDGRASTIYRAVLQRHADQAGGAASPESDGGEEAKMVALKVATVSDDGDTSHVDELRREADIAAMLQHNNICDLVGVASDAECYCLAYDFCEGGSLLSLLTDSSQYYEYLPIALDIANGMAYLHSRNVIHRDLKPSNILLTKDTRAKIADFGMSVANTGQELTAETGTYRWMAPEVIRHESYSSNADVYSFGVVLWQLITREVPFATMSPVQTAYAVAEGHRPEIPPSTPVRLREIIEACWDQDSQKRPSFTYIAMALADYAKMAFNPANVGAQTVQIANEMLANVQGNSTVNVDFSAPVFMGARYRAQPSLSNMNTSSGGSSRGQMMNDPSSSRSPWFFNQGPGSYNSHVGLEI